MPLLRPLMRGLKALRHRGAVDADIADEVQHYLDELTEAYVDRGLSPDAARRAAHIDLGGVTQVREGIRSFGWENAAVDFAADLRLGARRLVAAPVFTLVVILTLSLGLGATLAILGVASPILFEPLPYPGADRLVSIQEFP